MVFLKKATIVVATFCLLLAGNLSAFIPETGKSLKESFVVRIETDDQLPNIANIWETTIDSIKSRNPYSWMKTSKGQEWLIAGVYLQRPMINASLAEKFEAIESNKKRCQTILDSLKIDINRLGSRVDSLEGRETTLEINNEYNLYLVNLNNNGQFKVYLDQMSVIPTTGRVTSELAFGAEYRNKNLMVKFRTGTENANRPLTSIGLAFPLVGGISLGGFGFAGFDSLNANFGQREMAKGRPLFENTKSVYGLGLSVLFQETNHSFYIDWYLFADDPSGDNLFNPFWYNRVEMGYRWEFVPSWSIAGETVMDKRAEQTIVKWFATTQKDFQSYFIGLGVGQTLHGDQNENRVEFDPTWTGLLRIGYKF